MSDQTDNRTPEEIERDIERTRADFSSTVEALQQKLNPTELADQAVEYVMATPPVAYSVNLVNSARNNAMPLTMIGVGIAWLMASNRQAHRNEEYPRHQRVVRRAVYHSNGEVSYDGTHSSSTRTGGSSESMFNRTSSRVSQTGRDLKDKASEVGHRLSSSASGISERASQTGRGLRDKASEVGQRLSGSASDMTERARQMKQTATVRLQETAEEAQARVNLMSQRSQEQYYRAKDQFSQLLDEQPLVVGALGLAIGAALGATLPATRRENELLGPTRDDLLNRAKETTREHAETVKQSAQRVAEVAKDELGRVIEVAKEEAGHVVEAAKKETQQVRDKMAPQ